MTGHNRPMERVSFISIPRSGHHFIASNLQEMLGEIYCEGYACQDAFRRPIESCSRQKSTWHLNHCAKGLPITKSHDFSLQLGSGQYDKAVVLVRRDVYASLISWFEYDVKASERKMGSPELQSSQSFQEFLTAKLPYIMSFRDKYLKQENDKPVKELFLEDFIEPKSSFSQFSSLISFLGFEFSSKRLLDGLPIPFHGLRDPRQFKFFTQEDMERINGEFWK